MERTVAVLEKRDERQSDEPKTAGRGLTRPGLSPTVERMFGGLVDEYDDMGSDLPAETEAPAAAQPGAA